MFHVHNVHYVLLNHMCRVVQDMQQQQQVPREVDILMGCETGAMPLPAPDGIELPAPRPHHQPYSATARVAVQPCAPEYEYSTPPHSFTLDASSTCIRSHSFELWLSYLYRERTHSPVS